MEEFNGLNDKIDNQTSLLYFLFVNLDWSKNIGNKQIGQITCQCTKRYPLLNNNFQGDTFKGKYKKCQISLEKSWSWILSSRESKTTYLVPLL